MRYALASAKVASAALFLFAVPLCAVLAIALGPLPWFYEPARTVYIATLAGVVGLSMALLAVLREQDPAFARTLLRYSAAAIAIALLTMVFAIAIGPPHRGAMGA
jgi:hypothetical protein